MRNMKQLIEDMRDYSGVESALDEQRGIKMLRYNQLKPAQVKTAAAVVAAMMQGGGLDRKAGKVVLDEITEWLKA